MVAMTDEEQKEQLKSFMKRYGSPVIIGVLLALCAFFAWQWWHKKQAIEASNRTAQFQEILNQLSYLSKSYTKTVGYDGQRNFSCTRLSNT